MKTLLLILASIIPITGFCQIDPKLEAFMDSTEWSFVNTNYTEIEDIPFTEKDYIDAKIDKRIIELWREYESTLRVGGEYIYYYKEPSLTGFMEFIERKIN